MSLLQDIAPAGRVDCSRPTAQACGASMSAASSTHGYGNEPVKWLSAQAVKVTGDLQHNVRAPLMLKASSPMPVSDGHDEVASL